MWEWFWELSRSRAAGLAGPQPLSHREIQAWAQLSGRQPRPWEVAALRALDAAYLDFVAARQRTAQQGKGKAHA